MCTVQIAIDVLNFEEPYQRKILYIKCKKTIYTDVSDTRVKTIQQGHCELLVSAFFKVTFHSITFCLKARQVPCFSIFEFIHFTEGLLT